MRVAYTAGYRATANGPNVLLQYFGTLTRFVFLWISASFFTEKELDLHSASESEVDQPKASGSRTRPSEEEDEKYEPDERASEEESDDQPFTTKTMEFLSRPKVVPAPNNGDDSITGNVLR